MSSSEVVVGAWHRRLLRRLLHRSGTLRGVTIVIAGGSGFLGQKLAKRLEGDGSRGHDPDAQAGPRQRHPVEPRRIIRHAASAPGRHRRRRQPRGRGHRRQAMERRAEGGAAQQPTPGDANAGARGGGVRRSAAGVHQRVGGRLLRPPRRRADHRVVVARIGLSGRSSASNGNRRRASSSRRRRAWRSCARASSWPRTAARSRRCCCRSSSGWARLSDRVISSCRGFTSTTGRRWSRGCCRTIARPARSTRRRRRRSPIGRSRARSGVCCAGPRCCMRRHSCCRRRSARCRRSCSNGQRVLPAYAEQLGFRFTHRTLEPALRSLKL